jgi:hypothetical protein
MRSCIEEKLIGENVYVNVTHENVHVNVTHENLYCLKRGLLGEVFM